MENPLYPLLLFSSSPQSHLCYRLTLKKQIMRVSIRVFRCLKRFQEIEFEELFHFKILDLFVQAAYPPVVFPAFQRTALPCLAVRGRFCGGVPPAAHARGLH